MMHGESFREWAREEIIMLHAEARERDKIDLVQKRLDAIDAEVEALGEDTDERFAIADRITSELHRVAQMISSGNPGT